MRPIKFRAWHLEEKRWIDLNGIGIEFSGCANRGSAYDVTEQGNLNLIDVNHVDLQQFTGLKDKNGKEIYESDIVLTYEKNGDFFEEKPFVVDWIDKDEHGFGIGWGLFPNTFDYEVIGNIYEDGDLIESDKEV